MGASHSPPFRSTSRRVTFATEGMQEGEVVRSHSPPFKGRGEGWGLYILYAEIVREPTPNPSP